MWCIILYYILVIERPVSPNVFPFRSAVDMSNVYRTNMMQPAQLGQPSPQPAQLLPRQRPVCGPVPFPGCEQPTTCVENRQLSGLYNNNQRVCYTIRRWPDTVQQMVTTPQMQRYPPMGPPLLRQMPPHALITPRMLQPRSPQPLIPQMKVSQTVQQPQNVHKQSNNNVMGNVFQQNMTIAARLRAQNYRFPATPRQMQHVTQQRLQHSYLYPRMEHDYPLLMQLKDPTTAKTTGASTAPPASTPTGPTGPKDPTGPTGPSTPAPSTTSTMPPYPGGVKPDSDDNDEPFLLCPGGKAKCNKYIWTTKKKTHSKKTTKALLLWTI